MRRSVAVAWVAAAAARYPLLYADCVYTDVIADSVNYAVVVTVIPMKYSIYEL